MTVIRIGFLGCGEWARRKYLPYIKTRPELKLVAVSNLVSQQEKNDIEGNFREVSFFDDHEQLCKNSNIDCAIVALPHSMHYGAAFSALANHIPVLVDKPLSVDSESANSLVKLSKVNNTTLAVSSQRRTQDGNKMLREIIQKGDLGKISWLQAEFSHGSSPQWANTWRNVPELSGVTNLRQGVLLDTGYHMIDLILYVLQEFPVSVYAEVSFRHHQVDTDAIAILDFESGIRATAFVSRLLPSGYEIERVSALGVNGYAYAEKSRFGSRSAEHYAYRANNIDTDVLNNERSSALDPFIDFISHIKGSPLPEVWAAETTIPSLRVIDALYDSVIKNKPVML